MAYPADFPAHSRAAVAAEKLRAGKDFDNARGKLPWLRYGAGQELEAELRRYILRSFGVFVSEACTLGRQGIWHVDRVEKEALEFLRLSTIDATHSKGYDKSGRPFGREWVDNWGGNIKPEVRRQFERSSEWQQFQDALLQVAEAQEARSSDVGQHAGKQNGTITRHPAESERTSGTLPGAEAMPAQERTVATTDNEPDRSSVVDAFLLQCNRESAVGFKVIRKHIWLAAGHAHARQFQYWQERSDKATDEDDRNFRRILRMTPAQFIALLEKKNISPEKS